MVKRQKSLGGRPKTTGTGTLVALRCHKDFLSAIDAWRSKQEWPVSRPQAIIRLASLRLADERK